MTALFPATTFEPDATVRDGSSQVDNMIWIPGGTFRMGRTSIIQKKPRPIALPSMASGSIAIP